MTHRLICGCNAVDDGRWMCHMMPCVPEGSRDRLTMHLNRWTISCASVRPLNWLGIDSLAPIDRYGFSVARPRFPSPSFSHRLGRHSPAARKSRVGVAAVAVVAAAAVDWCVGAVVLAVDSVS